MVFVVFSHNGVVVVLGARKTKVLEGISPQNGSKNYRIFSGQQTCSSYLKKKCLEHIIRK